MSKNTGEFEEEKAKAQLKLQENLRLKEELHDKIVGQQKQLHTTQAEHNKLQKDLVLTDNELRQESKELATVEKEKEYLEQQHKIVIEKQKQQHIERLQNKEQLLVDLQKEIDR